MLRNKITLFFLNSFSFAFLLIIMCLLTFAAERLIRFGSIGSFPQGGEDLFLVGLFIGTVQATLIAILLYWQETVSTLSIALSTFLTAQIIDLYLVIPHLVNRYYSGNQKLYFSNDFIRFLLLNSILLLFCIFYGVINKSLINRLVNKQLLD